MAEQTTSRNSRFIERSLPRAYAVKWNVRHCILFLVCWLPASSGLAQTYGTGNHTVTIQVLPVTDVGIIGGGVTLSMTSANVVAGQNLITVTDQSTQLRWATNSSAQKITVNTNLAAPLFALKLLALNPTRGAAAPEVTLSTTAANFMTGIGRSLGTCMLKYTGIAYASQGIGTDNHIITFTVQAE
jgi:hypothetical protein